MPTAARLPGLETGLSGVCSAVVGPQDTCRSVGTGDLDVLATPKVLAMLECAALDALADLLEPELTTVGVRVQIEHLLPMGIGESIRATASLLTVRGRRLTFAVRLCDSEERVIGVGRLTRAVVERATFGQPEAD
ncbi:MAG TPA: hotdog domain-containing protein [Frankiaceae bacterium]|jgi:predicted thioesterase|nr:hotdog domain-containing protein [Frankiaceae bacterium]